MRRVLSDEKGFVRWEGFCQMGRVLSDGKGFIR
jgi:hypothetical protein